MSCFVLIPSKASFASALVVREELSFSHEGLNPFDPVHDFFRPPVAA
jgi:hypothetical protein